MDNQLSTIDESGGNALNSMDSVSGPEMITDIDIENIKTEIVSCTFDSTCLYFTAYFSITCIPESLQMGDDTEESFSCYLLRNPNEYQEKIQSCVEILNKHLQGLNAEQHEQTFRQLLKFAATIENRTRMKWLFDIFNQFIEKKVWSARYELCSILSFIYNFTFNP